MLNIEDFNKRKEKICIVGLGYVGLPLALLLNSKYEVIGFDNNEERIKGLISNFDKTLEVGKEALRKCTIEFTANPEKIAQCKIVIITVPTPIDRNNKPDLTLLKQTSKTVGKYLKKGSTVIYESTVYPGVTEEVCIPVIETESRFKWKTDFNVGYSPERVNPGDKGHTIDSVIKVVAGDCDTTGELLEKLYGSVVKAGIHKAPTIKTAEAAKVIENTQRDLNIALMNELSLIFNKMNIDTKDVLDAAGTKWNFLKFYPGLVGGHCIGVDPYYLTFAAESYGYHPEVILAGRRINDSVGKHIAEMTVKQLVKEGKEINGSKILILGVTFKENISDIRNSKVVDIYYELIEYGANIFVYDPHACPNEVLDLYGISLNNSVDANVPYDAVIFAVNHKLFKKNFTLDKVKNICKKDTCLIIDIKRIFNKKDAEKKEIIYWGL